MPGKLTDYLENELLDHVVKVGAWSRPSNLFLALCTANPGETATGANIVEPVGGAYARTTLTTAWGAAASRATSIATVLTYQTATANWGEITHFAILDTVTAGAGNALIYGEVSPSKIVATGMNISVEAGDLDVSWNAGGVGNALANALLDHVLKGTAYTPPTSIFAALGSAAILDSDTGTTLGATKEITGGGYARKEHNAWDAASGGASENTGIIAFAQASGAWSQALSFALTNHLTTGMLLFHGTLATARTLTSGDYIKFPDGALDVTMD